MISLGTCSCQQYESNSGSLLQCCRATKYFLHLSTIQTRIKCPILTKFWFPRQIFVKVPNTKLHENSSSRSRAGTWGEGGGRTDRDVTKLTDAFHDLHEQAQTHAETTDLHHSSQTLPWNSSDPSRKVVSFLQPDTQCNTYT